MAQPKANDKPTATKAPRDRSPAYPFISLKVCIDRLIAFDQKFQRHPAPLTKAGLAWGIKPNSSQAAQTLSALKYFGLVEYTGPTASRVAEVTEDGRNYMRAQQESVKTAILREAALRPKNLRLYWEKWGHDRPIDEICLDELVIKGDFTPTAAKTFLRVYDETVAFAGLINDSKMISQEDAETEPPPGVRSNVNATISAPTHPAMRPAALPLVTGSDHKQDNFSVDEGTIVLQWPQNMSATSFQDFEDWMEIQMRKIKRTIAQKSEDEKGA